MCQKYRIPVGVILGITISAQVGHIRVLLLCDITASRAGRQEMPTTVSHSEPTDKTKRPTRFLSTFATAMWKHGKSIEYDSSNIDRHMLT